MKTRMQVFMCASILVFLASHCYAHQMTTFGGTELDGTNSIVQTADGGYALAGITESFGAGGTDLWVLKLDSGHNVEWQKTFGGAGDEYDPTIIQATDGGYVCLIGETYSFGQRLHDSDVWVLKLNSNGNVQWQKTYGGDSWDAAQSIAQTSDGGYVLAGFNYSFYSPEYEIGDQTWVLKLGPNGSVQWEKIYVNLNAYHSATTAETIQLTADGGYALAGYEGTGWSNGHPWVMKLDRAGNAEWRINYNSSEAWSAGASSIVQTEIGGYAVAGYLNNGESDFLWILKLDAERNIEWEKIYAEESYGDFFSSKAFSFVKTANLGYAAAGYTYSSGSGNSDAFVLKIDEEGYVQWQKTYGGEGDESAMSIIQTADGGYAVAANTTTFGAGGSDIFMMKLDNYGNIPGCFDETNPRYVDSYDSRGSIFDNNLKYLFVFDEYHSEVLSPEFSSQITAVEPFVVCSLFEGTPSEQAAAIIDYIEKLIAAGELVGVGPGQTDNIRVKTAIKWIKSARLNILINNIKSAGDLFEAGRTFMACNLLYDVFLKVDGIDTPPDWFSGPAAPGVANIIKEFAKHNNCGSQG